jgi:hypothetical protein
MQMWHVVPENVDVDLVGLCRLAQRPAGSRQRRTERGRFRAVEVGEEWDVAFRLEVGEAGNRAVQHDGQPPEGVLPDPDPLEVGVGGGRIAEQASGVARDRVVHPADPKAGAAHSRR